VLAAELTAANEALGCKRELLSGRRVGQIVKGSRPSASHVAAQIAASPPTIYRGRRRRRRSVGWCDDRPVGRHCRACELRCQRGACEPELLHPTPPHPRPTKRGIIYKKPTLRCCRPATAGQNPTRSPISSASCRTRNPTRFTILLPRAMCMSRLTRRNTLPMQMVSVPCDFFNMFEFSV